jgi:alkanesulfonate monooxygenase SsuD/methylene tetrahydromethanopterin reductase-like flavin-dependent oxidoreductase (luciferase family)
LPKSNFGCQLPQDSDDFEHLIEVAKRCERLGYDSVWVYDHLSPFWSRTGRAFECWTTLSAIAARTNRIKIGTLVTNVSLRNPSLLAKMSSTLDNISNGRLIVGLGTGDKMSREELHSYGYRFPELNERIERLKESIVILKSMWTKEEATFHGKYHKISGAVNFPKPKQQPHPPIWIGGKHFKILDVAAEHADGWNYWGLTKAELERRNEYLKTKCTEYGRQPNTLLKCWSGTFRQLSKEAPSHSEAVSKVVGKLRDLAHSETRYFIASFDLRANPDDYEVFADAATGLS